jgi:hypothetical protein
VFATSKNRRQRATNTATAYVSFCHMNPSMDCVSCRLRNRHINTRHEPGKTPDRPGGETITSRSSSHRCGPIQTCRMTPFDCSSCRRYPAGGPQPPGGRRSRRYWGACRSLCPSTSPPVASEAPGPPRFTCNPFDAA